MFQPWRTEDFLPVVERTSGPIDFWEPADRSPQQATADRALPHDTGPFDFWDPVPSAPPRIDVAVVDWSENTALSLFETGASENPFSFDEAPITREGLARRRARWLASLLDIPTIAARRWFADKFEEIFDQFSHHSTFRVLSEIALEGASADELLTAYQLRIIWADHPMFWSIRRKGFRGPFVPDGGEKLLGWTRAVRLANLSRGLPAERIIDEDWYEEWLRIPFGDPLYWTFVEYATARLESFAKGVLSIPEMLTRQEERGIDEVGARAMAIDGLKLGSFARTGLLVRLESDSLAFSYIDDAEKAKPSRTIA